MPLVNTRSLIWAQISHFIVSQYEGLIRLWVLIAQSWLESQGGLSTTPFFSTNLTYRHAMTSQVWNSKSIMEIRDRIKGGLRPALNWPGISQSQKLWRQMQWASCTAAWVLQGHGAQRTPCGMFGEPKCMQIKWQHVRVCLYHGHACYWLNGSAPIVKSRWED